MKKIKMVCSKKTKKKFEENPTWWQADVSIPVKSFGPSIDSILVLKLKELFSIVEL